MRSALAGNVGPLALGCPKGASLRAGLTGGNSFGDPATVHEAGISVRGAVISERRVKEENFWRYIVGKPQED
ncbi:MAG: hypothetical protein R3D33_15395 [Hyphomicrobiaceae bacterium]